MENERAINVSEQEITNSELKYCNSTQKLFECKKLKQPLFKKLYSGKLNNFYDKQKYLLDIRRDYSSEEQYCQDNNLPNYIFKKVLEEYGITSYTKPSKLINLVYRDVADLEESTFSLRQENFIEILDKFNNIEELAKHFKISMFQMYRYGIIFGVNLTDFYKKKNSGNKDYKNPINKYFMEHRYKNNQPKKNNEKNKKGEESMNIPSEIIKAVNEKKVVEDKKTTKKKNVTVNNDSKQDDVEHVDQTVNKEKEDNISLTDKLQEIRDRIFSETSKDEFTEAQIENYVKIKQIDFIIDIIIKENWIFKSTSNSNLRFDFEFNGMRSQIKKIDPNLTLSRKAFSNYLENNIERKYLVYEGEELVGLKGVISISNCFRNYLNEFYQNPDKKVQDCTEELVKEFCHLSNILSYDRVLSVVKKYYTHLYKVRKNEKDDDRIKAYVQNYLKLWDRTCDEQGNKIPYNQRRNVKQQDKTEIKEEIKKVEETTFNDLPKEEKEIKEEEIKEEVITSNIVTDNNIVINSKEDLDKFYGLIQGMLMTGNHFKFEIEG